GAGFIHSEKALRYAIYILRFDADSRILNKNQNSVFAFGKWLYSDRNRSALLVIFDSIFDKIDKHLLYLVAVGANKQVLVKFTHIDLHVLFLGFVLQTFNNVHHYVTQVDILSF